MVNDGKISTHKITSTIICGEKIKMIPFKSSCGPRVDKPS